ncbi:MAG: hypothetical protein IJV17_05825 [Prevotella sp.]|nr:hypothetical protein [Prevotella sp.]
MRKLLDRYWRWGLTMLMGIGVLLFWGLGYPHALSYHEQYQLFLWTTDYFLERMSVAGGFADWAGEFITQFYYLPWLGAILLAVLYMLLQRAIASLLSPSLYLLSFLPLALLLWHMGDLSVLLSYSVALVLVVGLVGLVGRVGLAGKAGMLGDVLVIPIVYWLLGPMVWLYVLLRVVQGGWKQGWLLLWTGLLLLLLWTTLLDQWPLEMVMGSMTYTRIPLHIPVLQWLIPVVVVILAGVSRLTDGANGLDRLMGRYGVIAGCIQAVAVIVIGWFAIDKGYDPETYELVWQDYQIRHEQWDKIIKRANKHVVRTSFWSNSVNLALSQKRLLADRMFDFYQSGDDALIMPRKRDLTSNLPSAEAYYRLGLVNSAQRYMFDIQESILNGKKSGRCTKRIVECMLVNGHYKPALKHINLLKKSLFYRGWAEKAEQVITSDAKTRETRINAHPQLGRLRQIRFKDDFLYSHAEKDKIFGLLFMNNHDNKMALDYFIGELLLRGNVQAVIQYMPWAEQYGGYRQMPIGYQDAVQCIRQQGNLPGSMYGNYVKRMMGR